MKAYEKDLNTVLKWLIKQNVDFVGLEVCEVSLKSIYFRIKAGRFDIHMDVCIGKSVINVFEHKEVIYCNHGVLEELLEDVNKYLKDE